MKHKPGLSGARRLFVLQLFVTLVFACFALQVSVQAAVSVIIGGLLSAVPTACFAKMLFQHYGAQDAKKIVGNFYKGEALKLILTAAMFALTFTVFDSHPVYLFAAFCVAQITLWLTPLIIGQSRL